MPELHKDPTIISLLAANLITIFLAVNQNWELASLLWVYWFQSLIIGFFMFLKLRHAKEVQSMYSHHPMTEGSRIELTKSFITIYVFVHLVYMQFLKVTRDFEYIVILSFLFFLNHTFSHFYYFSRPKKKESMNKMVGLALARVMPMHLVILVAYAANAKDVLIVFLLLKTVVDLIMHIIEHKDQ